MSNTPRADSDLERELAQARRERDEARSHMNLARLEAQCPDDNTLVMHCRELRSTLTTTQAEIDRLIAYGKLGDKERTELVVERNTLRDRIKELEKERDEIKSELETIRPILGNLRWHANAICSLSGRAEHNITTIVMDVIRERDHLKTDLDKALARLVVAKEEAEALRNKHESPISS